MLSVRIKEQGPQIGDEKAKYREGIDKYGISLLAERVVEKDEDKEQYKCDGLPTPCRLHDEQEQDQKGYIKSANSVQTVKECRYAGTTKKYAAYSNATRRTMERPRTNSRLALLTCACGPVGFRTAWDCSSLIPSSFHRTGMSGTRSCHS